MFSYYFLSFMANLGISSNFSHKAVVGEIPKITNAFTLKLNYLARASTVLGDRGLRCRCLTNQLVGCSSR